jgi:Ca2+:H+ antiporter
VTGSCRGMFRKVAYGFTIVLSAAGIAAEYLNALVPVVFVLSALAMVGLAWLLSQATESLGHHAGPRVGGILGATFGNAAELIITVFALLRRAHDGRQGLHHRLGAGQRALGFGHEHRGGGLKNGTQRFSSTIAGANATMLAIVAVGLSLPTIFAATGAEQGARATEYLSISEGIVLVVVYALALVFYFGRPAAGDGGAQNERPAFGPRVSLALMLGVAGAIAVVSEVFVGSIEPIVKDLGLSELFVRVILVPLIGNAAEQSVGISIAYKNDMDFSRAISLGSSSQIALLVTPILVFLGPLLGHPLNLVFSPLELGALAATVVVTGFVALDGESNWLEGMMLCGVYLIAALAFFSA